MGLTGINRANTLRAENEDVDEPCHEVIANTVVNIATSVITDTLANANIKNNNSQQ
jgi:hypothetical protein